MQEFILHETNKSQFWLVLKQILSTGKRWHIKISSTAKNGPTSKQPHVEMEHGNSRSVVCYRR